jgi:hypothetical protein
MDAWVAERAAANDAAFGAALAGMLAQGPPRRVPDVPFAAADAPTAHLP